MKTSATTLTAIILLIGCGSTEDESRPSLSGSIEPVLTIDGDGSTDGPVFGRVIDVEFGMDGTILVADRQTNEIHVFDQAGTLLRTIGGEGDGPGEFQFLTGIAVSHQGAFVAYDPLGDRLTWVDPDGSVRTEPSHKQGWSVTIPWAGTVSNVGFLVDISTVSTGEESTHNLIHVGVSDSGAEKRTGQIPAIEQPTYTRRANWGGQTSTLPFAPETIRRLSPLGSVWLAEHAGYQVVEVGIDGDTLTAISRSEQGAELSNRARDSAAVSAGVSKQLIPKRRSLIQGLAVDHIGQLWVIAKGEDSARFWDRWSEDGSLERFRSTVPYEVERVVPAIQGDSILGVVRDELDRQSVVLSVVRPLAP